MSKEFGKRGLAYTTPQKICSSKGAKHDKKERFICSRRGPPRNGKGNWEEERKR